MARNNNKQDAIYRNIYSDLALCIRDSPYNFKYKLENAISKGFPIDFQPKYGMPLLCIAFWYNNTIDAKTDIIMTLLDNGANPNVTDTKGSRPLDIAIYLTYPLNVIERLVEAGSSVNAKDRNGTTAFALAAWLYIISGRYIVMDYAVSVIELLLKHNADPYLCVKWKFPHWAEYSVAVNTEKLESSIFEFESWLDKRVKANNNI